MEQLRGFGGRPPRHLTMGDPLALGLAAFGVALFIASVPWSGILAESEAVFALPVALVLGGVTLLMGIRAYDRSHDEEDTLVGTMLGALGAFWLSWGALEWMIIAEFLPVTVPGPGESVASATGTGLMGTFFLAWTVLVALLFVASLTENLAVGLVLLGTAITFGSITIANWVESEAWLNVAGWAGIVTAAVTGYVVLADTLNRMTQRTILPMAERYSAAEPEPQPQ